jgi:hypothetical protein
MKAKAASNRAFGILIATVLALIAAYLYWVHRAGYVPWLLGAAIFFPVALVMPRLLYPLKRLWLKLGNLLHVVISPVILGVLYVASIVSVGLIARLFGKDPLSLRTDDSARSYWIRREQPGPAPASLKNQF